MITTKLWAVACVVSAVMAAASGRDAVRSWYPENAVYEVTK